MIGDKATVESVARVLLPQDQWEVSLEGGALMLSAWVNGPNEDTRYWVKFSPSDPAKDQACLNDLEGVFAPIGDGNSRTGRG